jgi:hypothetical protein
MPRQDERVTFLKEVHLEFASGRRLARISDISMGGCYLESIVQVQKGERFSLEIASTNGDSATFTGEVAYVFEGMGFGVMFIDPDDQSRQFLDRIIQEKSS